MVIYMKYTVVWTLNTCFRNVNYSPAHESMRFFIKFISSIDVVPLVKPIEKVILSGSWLKIFTINFS
jgi:hypothetical protein